MRFGVGIAGGGAVGVPGRLVVTGGLELVMTVGVVGVVVVVGGLQASGLIVHGAIVGGCVQGWPGSAKHGSRVGGRHFFTHGSGFGGSVCTVGGAIPVGPTGATGAAVLGWAPSSSAPNRTSPVTATGRTIQLKSRERFTVPPR
jgi:hypothetical protein